MTQSAFFSVLLKNLEYILSMTDTSVSSTVTFISGWESTLVVNKASESPLFTSSLALKWNFIDYSRGCVKTESDCSVNFRAWDSSSLIDYFLWYAPQCYQRLSDTIKHIIIIIRYIDINNLFSNILTGWMQSLLHIRKGKYNRAEIIFLKFDAIQRVANSFWCSNLG